MRIQQLKVPTNWVANSDDPAKSLESYVKGAWSAEGLSDYLVDDQRRGVPGLAYNKPLVSELDNDTGIAFAAKDGDTLERGFMALFQKTGLDTAYRIKSGNNTGLTALYIEWDGGAIRNRSKIGAAVSTVSFNTGQALKRFGIAIFPAKGFLKRHGVTLERFQSISANMERAGRDGRILAKGACLYICHSAAFPPANLRWGRVSRQIDSSQDMGDLKTLTTQLSA